jgi:hypothetical protein
VKLSFYYAFVSYNISSAKNQVINRVTLTNDLVSSNENIPEIKIHNFSVGMPVPYMFTKGLKETMKMNVNPDTMNFYMYMRAINTIKFQM